jgi:tRNA (guanine10-N2)-methyltransferase
MASSSALPAMATVSDNERYLVLVEFAYKHLDFQLAELESVLDMYKIQLDGPDCKVVPLPASTLTTAAEVKDKEEEEGTKKYKQPLLPGKRPFIILSFPIKDSKVVGLETIRNKDSNDDDNAGNDKNDNTIILNKAARKWDFTQNNNKAAGIAEILSRCTLVKSVVELWGYGVTMDQCALATQDWVRNTTLGQSIFQTVSTPSQSWKLSIHTLGTRFTRDEQAGMRHQFSYLGFEGLVQMTDPDHEYMLIREVEMDGKGSPMHPRHGLGKMTLIPENDARPPLACYFGRVLGGGVRKGREGLSRYDLKHRAYLGPTSMDSELSFVMTNFGQVQTGSIVLDPFVGTGSILLSCALRGAYCIGADIDIRVLKGRSDTENIFSNFDQFQLPRPEIMRTDNAHYDKHFRQHSPYFDAIVCDPPYGIRAGARKTGSRLEDPRPILEEHRHDHIAQTQPYPVSEVMEDLLDMASKNLRLDGRLVYIIPSFSDFNPDVDLPRHPCLQLVHSCYQPLSIELGRRIVVMKKVQAYQVAQREKYMESMWVHGRESAEKCANLRDKILEAAMKKPGYQEKAVIRKQKRKATKEAKKLAKVARKSGTP